MPKKIEIQAEIAVRHAVRHAFKKDKNLFEFLVSAVYEAGQSQVIPELLAKTKLGPRIEEFRCPFCYKFGRHKECIAKEAKWKAGQKKLSSLAMPAPEIFNEPRKIEIASPQEELAASVATLKKDMCTPVVAARERALSNMKKKLKDIPAAMDFLNKLKDSHGIK